MSQNPNNYIGKHVRIYWDSEDDWFPGIIDNYESSKGYHVQYDDGDEEWIEELTDIVRFDDMDEDLNEDDNPELEVIKNEDADLELELMSIKYNVSDLKENADLKVEYKEEQQEKNEQEEDQEEEEEEEEEEDYVENKGEEDEDVPDRMVILTGSVFAGCDLPSIPQSETDGPAFFRVLFAENISESSSMFQCKTTIFKSECASDLYHPVWFNRDDPHEMFQFEMMIPETFDNTYGEIIVAIYRSREQGGNDFVGQVSLPVYEFERSGIKIVKKNRFVECRSLSRWYALKDRSKTNLNAKLDIRLSLSWKRQLNANNSVLPMIAEAKLSNNEYLNEDNKTSSKLERSGGRGGRGRGGGLKKSSQAAAVVSVAVGSIKKAPSVSASARHSGSQRESRKKLAAKRIEWENEKMRARLNKHATAASKLKNNQDGAAAAAAAAAAAQQGKKSSADRKITRPRPTPEIQQEVDSALQKYSEYDKLLQIHNKLKTIVGNLQKDVNSLKAVSTRLVLSNKKNTIILEKLKKAVPNAEKYNEAFSEMRKDPEAQHKADIRASVNAFLRNDDKVESGGSSGKRNGNNNGAAEYKLMNDFKDDLGIENYQSNDSQLQTMIAEFSTLQSHRRALVGRINKTKDTNFGRMKKEAGDMYRLNRAFECIEMDTSSSDRAEYLKTYQRKTMDLDILKFKKSENIYLDSICSELEGVENIKKLMREKIEEQTKVNQELKLQLASLNAKIKEDDGSNLLFDMKNSLNFFKCLHEANQAKYRASKLIQKGIDLEVAAAKFGITNTK